MYKRKRVLVAGATGLVGSHIVDELLQLGASVRIVVHRRPNPFRNSVDVVKGDLRLWETCKKAVKGMDYVIQCAAVTGGLLRNKLDPASVFTPNILINTQMLDAAREANIERYLFSSNISVYPDSAKPVKEGEAWNGVPHESAVGAAWVRRMGELQSSIYAQQFGLKIAITRGGNAYGARDMFFDTEYSHVIPALIVKAVRKENPFVVWGSGESWRDFIHASDLAHGMLLALEKYAVGDPVNIGSGNQVQIKDVVSLILRLTGHDKTPIKFDERQPLGPLKKIPDLTKCKEKLGFSPRISLEEGLKQTIGWYLENKDYMKGYRSD